MLVKRYDFLKIEEILWIVRRMCLVIAKKRFCWVAIMTLAIRNEWNSTFEKCIKDSLLRKKFCKSCVYFTIEKVFSYTLIYIWILNTRINKTNMLSILILTWFDSNNELFEKFSIVKLTLMLSIALTVIIVFNELSVDKRVKRLFAILLIANT